MKFRTKPVIKEAIQYTGKNADEVYKFSNGVACRSVLYQKEDFLEIETLEGVMFVDKKDWVIKGINGEFYPCKPDIFEATYEKVEG